MADGLSEIAEGESRERTCAICGGVECHEMGCPNIGSGKWDDPYAGAEDRLHRKYYGLRRTKDASFVEGWYFVIREGDKAGEAALLAYADACESYAPELAADLRSRVKDERIAQGLYDSMWER